MDVLNPDVVAFRGRYLMYFSGNDSRTEDGNWRTGLATASSPIGPFHVQLGLEGNYLNGGTAVWQGHLWHVVEDNPDIRGELASSSDGIHWKHASFLPGFVDHGLRYHGADFFLEPHGSRLNVYMLAVPTTGGLGRSLAIASYAAGHWSSGRVVLPIKAAAALSWASADLGEPATYQLADEHYMLFVGLAQADHARSIGLAHESPTGWRICGDKPALANGTPGGGASSIDPSPVVSDKRLYLYYGATRVNGLASNLGGSVGVRVFTEPRH